MLRRGHLNRSRFAGAWAWIYRVQNAALARDASRQFDAFRRRLRIVCKQPLQTIYFEMRVWKKFTNMAKIGPEELSGNQHLPARP